MRKPLLEYLPFQVSKKTLQESMGGGGLIVEGIVQRANAKNHNGRIYPREILENQINQYIDGPIKENRSYGELDHPDSEVINLGNTSHIVRKVWWNGDDVMGKIEILDTPPGKILQELFKKGCTVGISSRGMGSVQDLDEGTVEVQDDFELLCWDFVSTPSTHGAFMEPRRSMNESKTKTNIYPYTRTNEIISNIICDVTGVCDLPKKKMKIMKKSELRKLIKEELINELGGGNNPEALKKVSRLVTFFMKEYDISKDEAVSLIKGQLRVLGY